MEFGICQLSIVPMRLEPADTAEMVNQVLFSEVFKVIEKRKKWVKIRLAHDQYEGWIDVKQYLPITKEVFKAYSKFDAPMVLSPADLLECPKNPIENQMVVQGSWLNGIENENIRLGEHLFQFSGPIVNSEKSKEVIVKMAYSYINTPYLWGGRSPFGIDCSGFTQLCYRFAGVPLSRDASQQAQQGVALSFIEEATPGDLAFFDNAEGKIIHVGIILKDNFIIHASGKVRLDRLDQSGIYNPELRRHTHRLRVIKKLF